MAARKARVVGEHGPELTLKAQGAVVKFTSYRVINGISYGPHRGEPGEVRDDIPASSVPWLLEQGHIEPANEED